MRRRSADKVVADLVEATEKARALVARGRNAFDEDEMLHLAGEAILGRIGDAWQKLQEHYGGELPQEVPWADIVSNRSLVDHVYHRIDYDVVWATLQHDVPVLAEAMRAWIDARPAHDAGPPRYRDSCQFRTAFRMRRRRSCAAVCS